MINKVFGTKLGSTRCYTETGEQIPVSKIGIMPLKVTQVKTDKTDGYNSIQVGFGLLKNKLAGKPLLGHLKQSGVKEPFRYLREIKTDVTAGFKPGDEITLKSVLKPGDLVKVTGVSKGKGFTGVMKRWGFKGGPRTHGQSDRQRAPGSIGQTTTPGRVYKGKKMAGRSGGQQVAIRNLTVVSVDEENNLVLVKGLIPGFKTGLVEITKTGETKIESLLSVGKSLLTKKEEAGSAEEKEEKVTEDKPEKETGSKEEVAEKAEK